MYILAIDQGTTGTTAILCDAGGQPVARAYREFKQIYPQPGWVEHDPLEIWQTVLETVSELLAARPGPITAVGLTNQRETTILWDAATGQPIYNAIVWQCRRTAAICDRLRPNEALFKQKTGLPLDPYFSGTKIKWLLDRAGTTRPERLLFGTVDTWLIWKLTGGRTHATDYTNASRTLLFNIHTKKWDAELCNLLEIPIDILPEVKNSAADYGVVESLPGLAGVPILGVAGDQQAALFGQTCFAPGQIKNTYGTGCFAVLNTGQQAIASTNGLITTLAIDENGRPCYALEGSVFIAGAAIQWLRDELGLLRHAGESEAAALAVPDNGGVYLVPAFVGLGAPYWDAQARGLITGLTRGANRNHLIRAALEAMAFQTYDVLAAMERETGIVIPALAVDGGATANNFLLQFQADILNKPVLRPACIESTSIGAAYLAGLQAGVWRGGDMLNLKAIERRFDPAMPNARRQELLAGWHHALRQAMTR